MEQLEKTKRFREEYGLAVPIIMAPMAGACPPSLAAAVSNAGGMGSLRFTDARPRTNQGLDKGI